MSLNYKEMVHVNGILKQGIEKIKYYKFFETDSKVRMNDNDLLEYLADTLDKKMESTTNEDKYILKLLVAILKVIANAEKELKEETISRVSGYKPKYQEYLNRNGFEPNEVIKDKLDKVGKAIIGGNIFDEDGNVKEVEDKPVELSEFEKIKNELIAKIKEAEELGKELALKEKVVVKSEGRVNSFKEKLAEQRKLVKSLNKQLDIYTCKVKELEKELKKKDTTLVNRDIYVETLKKQIEEIESRLATLEKEYASQSVIVTGYRESEDLEYTRKTLIDLITNLLFDNEYTLESLTKELNNKGFSIDSSEVYGLLMEVSKSYPIVKDGIRTFPVVYKICAPKLGSNYSFRVPAVKNNKLELLFVSDLHITDISLDVLSKLDSTYDYATSNGINLIINLGDITDEHNKITNSRLFVLDNIINKLPKANGIYHAILGGNHDKFWVDVGIDLVKFLSENREDIIDLGYSHAFIDFNDSKEDSIALHHFNNKFTMVDPFGRQKTDISALNNAIHNYYSTQDDRDRENTYIDMFGHFHKSSLDNNNGVCCVPSLLKDRYQDGAWHGTIYFDSTGRISEILFKPLIFSNDKLISTTEIEYKKLVLK